MIYEEDLARRKGTDQKDEIKKNGSHRDTKRSSRRSLSVERKLGEIPIGKLKQHMRVPTYMRERLSVKGESIIGVYSL